MPGRREREPGEDDVDPEQERREMMVFPPLPYPRGIPERAGSQSPNQEGHGAMRTSKFTFEQMVAICQPRRSPRQAETLANGDCRDVHCGLCKWIGGGNMYVSHPYVRRRAAQASDCRMKPSFRA